MGLNRLPKNLEGKKWKEIGVNYLIEEHSNVRNKKTKKEGYFFSRPRFAEALAFNLSPVAYLMNIKINDWQWRFSPVGAVGALACFFFPKALGGVAFIGTVTDYSTLLGGVVAIDSPGDANWDTVHDATAGDNVNASHYSYTGVGTDDSSRHYIYRAFFAIDTSGLTSGATISAASLFTWLANGYDDYADAYGYLNVVQTSQASGGTDLVVGDFDQCGAIDNPTKGAADIDLTGKGISYNDWLEFVLTATGRGWISKTGYSLLGTREGHDIQDQDPGAGASKNSLASLYSGREEGTHHDPYLHITYTSSTTYSKKITSRARIKIIGIAKKETIRARIKKTLNKLTSAKARILTTGNEKEIQLKGRIKITGEKAVAMRAMIEKTPKGIVSARARIFNTEDKKNTSRARIKITENKNNQIKARVKRIESTINQSRARVKQAGVEYKISSKSRIKKLGIESKATARARIKTTRSRKATMRARIFFNRTKTITSRGRIKTAGIEYKQTSRARIKTTAANKLSSKGRIVKLGSGKFTARAKIKQVGTIEKITARARLKKTISAGALTGRAKIKAKSTFKPLGNIRKQSPLGR